MFYFDKLDKFEILKSDFLSNINHFFTTRNFILKTKEEEYLNVAKNNREFLKKIFNLDKIITPNQRHTDNIKIAMLDDDDYSQTDSLILTDKRIGIFLNFADCTPIIFYDKINNIGAVSHAGWRGTVKKISQKTVSSLVNNFNSKPENIISLIGPSICKNCFETSYEIAEKLTSTIKNGKKYMTIKDDKAFVDLKMVNKLQLNEIGVKIIDVAPYCTCCNNDKFFSYRFENKTTNRISAFICLN